jgi:hypothetical protein
MTEKLSIFLTADQTEEREMNKLMMTVIALSFVSFDSFAQKQRDVKRLDRTENKISKRIDQSLKYFDQDNTSKFQCFPDYQIPFEALKQNITQAGDEAKLKISDINERIKAELAPEIAELEALKKRRKKEREPGIKEVIAAKEKSIQQKATHLRDELKAEYDQVWVSLNSASGMYKFAINEKLKQGEVIDNFRLTHKYDVGQSRNLKSLHMQNVISLLESCDTASCVFLLGADLKKLNAETNKAFSHLRIIGGVNLNPPRTVNNRRVNKVLDHLISEIAKEKPLGQFDVNACLGKNGKIENDVDLNDDERSGFDNRDDESDNEVEINSNGNGFVFGL